jgi:hypothetical protein
MTERDICEALDRIFDTDADLYRQRGFMRRIGFGKRPALLNIDLAHAWTRPGYPFTCDGMDEIIPGVQKLLNAARARASRSSSPPPPTGCPRARTATPACGA